MHTRTLSYFFLFFFNKWRACSKTHEIVQIFLFKKNSTEEEENEQRKWIAKLFFSPPTPQKEGKKRSTEGNKPELNQPCHSESYQHQTTVLTANKNSLQLYIQFSRGSTIQ